MMTMAQSRLGVRFEHSKGYEAKRPIASNVKAAREPLKYASDPCVTITHLFGLCVCVCLCVYGREEISK